MPESVISCIHGLHLLCFIPTDSKLPTETTHPPTPSPVQVAEMLPETNNTKFDRSNFSVWPLYPLQKGHLLPPGFALQDISSVFSCLTSLLTGQSIPKTVDNTIITDLCRSLIPLIPVMDADEKGIKELPPGQENHSSL